MPTSSPTEIETSAVARKAPLRQYSLAARRGVILSVGMVVAIAVMVIIDPTKRSVSAGYMHTALRFWD